MQKVQIKLENCYGIKKLDSEFDYTRKKVFVVYAPNGIMKTSLAKTFQDLSKGEISGDRIYKDRATIRIIKDETGAELQKELVFVIDSYDAAYKSSRVSTLLVNKDLKEQYEETHRTINEKKETLIKELKAVSGLKTGIEETISEAIANDPKEFYRSLVRLRSEVLEERESALGDISYQRIFNDKVLALVESEEFRKNLRDYIETYDQLISKSAFFRKGIFNHNNATDIARNLKENGFFKASHSVYVTVEGGRKEVASEAELEKVIQQEKDSILKNSALAKSFEEIDKKITKNKDLKDFREYVEGNKFLLPELENLNRLKQKLWVAYLMRCKGAYKDLLDAYDKGKAEIDGIVKKAKQEATKWQEVIRIFNERFSVPFIVSMENQDDVILKSEAPNIKFEFRDSEDGPAVSIVEPDLLKVLSHGERRALYILNIIFEVQARKESRQETLFVVDDIADSFDYKNKYAIVEYLRDISLEDRFYQIILTHNFDFYRTISGRFDLERENKLYTVKSIDSIKLVQETYQKNPFDHWKTNLNKGEFLVAAIPFVRNLAEFCGFDNHYLKLTSLLHQKQDTDQLTIGELEGIVKAILQDQQSLVLENRDKKVKQLIYDLADTILGETDEIIELEKKIVLSIAIRLKAENFMIAKINDGAFVAGISNHQTFELIRKFKEMFPSEAKNINLVERVNLMTPENIHLNSFMYEPILDMSNMHLKQLYRDVSGLLP
jgi:hypothetical protein